MIYAVEISKNELTKEYVLQVPDLPGCQVVEQNIQQGMTALNDAMAAHLQILSEYGEKIPSGLPLDSHISQSSDDRIIWAMIDFDIVPFMGKSQKINVTLPELLIKQIDDRVSKSAEHKTRSGFIAKSCLTELNRI